MHQYGPLPPWEAAGVMALMILAASPYFLAFTILLTWIARRDKNLAIWAAPFLWVAPGTGSRTRMPDIAFPWNLLGYAVSGNLALIQLTSITGIYGLSFVVAAYNALVVWLMRSQGARKLPAAVLAASTLPDSCRGAYRPSVRSSTAPPSQLAHLVQTNLPQSMEYPANWDALHAGDMSQLDRISIEAGQKDRGLIRLARGSRAVFAKPDGFRPPRAGDCARLRERLPARCCKGGSPAP